MSESWKRWSRYAGGNSVIEVVRASAIGLLAGSLLAVVAGIAPLAERRRCDRDLGGDLLRWPARLLGALIGLLRGRSIRLAAATVDRCYELKDRAATAVDFIRRGQPTPLHVLQVADAERHLRGIDVRRVAPYRIPKVDAVCTGGDRCGFGPIALAADARGFTPGRRSRSTRFSRPRLEAEESLEDLEEAAKKDNDPKLKELVQKLNETIQEMKLPGVDTKEALAKLSEMQAAITAQQAQFNVGLVDAQMQSRWARRWPRPRRSKGPGKALQDGKYDKAAEQLEKAEPKFDRKETKTLKDKLAQAAKAMQEAGLAELSTATTELSESMEDEASSRRRMQEAWQSGPRTESPQEDQRPAGASVPEPGRVQRQLPEEQHRQAAAAEEDQTSRASVGA